MCSDETASIKSMNQLFKSVSSQWETSHRRGGGPVGIRRGEQLPALPRPATPNSGHGFNEACRHPSPPSTAASGRYRLMAAFTPVKSASNCARGETRTVLTLRKHRKIWMVPERITHVLATICRNEICFSQRLNNGEL